MAARISFAVENARCFQFSGFLPIRPLTFLVGENSSGKTSYFALFYEAMSFFLGPLSTDSTPFFDLGSFEELIHNPGKRGAKNPFYSVSLRFDAEFPELRALDPATQSFSLTFAYNEVRGQRSAHRIGLRSGNYLLEIERAEGHIHVTVSSGLERAVFAVSDGSRANFLFSYAWGVSRLIGLAKSYCTGKGEAPYEIKLIESNFSDLAFLRVLLGAFENTFDQVCEEARWLITPSAPIRSEPRRVYTIHASQAGTPEADRIPQTLNRLRQYEPQIWDRVHTKLVDFGKQSGLFSDLDVKPLRGKRGGGPFEIIVTRGAVDANLTDVGYGVSQVIPFISDILIADAYEVNEPYTRLYYVQQPETHLHPAAQAALGTFFYELSKKPRRKVVLETHSDYMVDRVRQRIRAEKGKRADDCALLFFENTGGFSTAHAISFDAMGNVVNAPEGYREFFVREELKNLGVIDVSDN